ncbi:MAG TPA: penicillin-binding protein activator, partial [Anaeromyxobacteraceae bacterium]|nr:penicillin-binding protein activator [Anaeromyxobacteraceae bacterium]
MRSPTSPRALAALLAALGLAACAAPRVVVRGQEVAPAEADALVRHELDALRASTASLPPADRAARLEAFAARYPGVPLAAGALHEAARAWLSAGDAQKASSALGRLLVEHPLYPDATLAKYDLALTDVALGRARDGLST